MQIFNNFNFNDNSSFSKRAYATSLLLTGSLLTSCNQQSGYRMYKPDQATTPSEEILNQEQDLTQQKKELDALYTQIYEAKSDCDSVFKFRSLLQANPQYKTQFDWLIPEWLAFKKYVESNHLNIQDTLRACSERTGLKLSSCHLYNLIHAAGSVDQDSNTYSNAYTDLAHQAIYSEVVDTTISLHKNDTRKQLEDLIRTCSTLRSIELLYYALEDIDFIHKFQDICFNNDKETYLIIINSTKALEAYKKCIHMQCMFQLTPTYLRSTILDEKLIAIKESIEPYLFSTATTMEDRIVIAQYIGVKRAVLHRHMFEIADDKHPDGTGILHPYMYEQLSAMGIPLDLTDEALQIKKTFLQTHYPQLFNQYKPYIPEFQDEESRENMLRNRHYMDVYRAPNAKLALQQLITFYKDTLNQGLNFKTVLKECIDDLGGKLTIHFTDSDIKYIAPEDVFTLKRIQCLYKENINLKGNINIDRIMKNRGCAKQKFFKLQPTTLSQH